MIEVTKESSNFLICHCPVHVDKVPSFYINKCDNKGHKKGFSFCYGCGHTAQYSSEWVDKMSKKKTRIRKRQLINWYNLALKYSGWITTMPIGLTWKTRIKYLLGWDGEAWTIPMQNEKMEIIGIQLRFPNGSKSCVEGSELGLFIPGPMSYEDSKRTVVTEGFSDSAVSTECGFYGLGYPSASYGHDIIVKFLINHAVDTVVTVSDSDEAGKKSAQKIKFLAEQKGIGVRIVSCEPYKDLRKYFEIKGKEETTKLLKGN